MVVGLSVLVLQQQPVQDLPCLFPCVSWETWLVFSSLLLPKQNTSFCLFRFVDVVFHLSVCVQKLEICSLYIKGFPQLFPPLSEDIGRRIRSDLVWSIIIYFILGFHSSTTINTKIYLLFLTICYILLNILKYIITCMKQINNKLAWKNMLLLSSIFWTL